MPLPTETIQTARLELVPLRVDDAPEMTAVLADPVLYEFIGGVPPSTAELARRYRVQVRGRPSDAPEAWRNWIVRERASGVATGFVQATIVRRDPGPAGSFADAEIAWLIGTPWQRRGYASEAAVALVAWLERIGVTAIVAHVHPDHAGSAAVAQRAGLTPTDGFSDGERVWTRTAPRVFLRAVDETGPPP